MLSNAISICKKNLVTTAVIFLFIIHSLFSYVSISSQTRDYKKATEQLNSYSKQQVYLYQIKAELLKSVEELLLHATHSEGSRFIKDNSELSKLIYDSPFNQSTSLSLVSSFEHFKKYNEKIAHFFKYNKHSIALEIIQSKLYQNLVHDFLRRINITQDQVRSSKAQFEMQLSEKYSSIQKKAFFHRCIRASLFLFILINLLGFVPHFKKRRLRSTRVDENTNSSIVTIN